MSMRKHLDIDVQNDRDQTCPNHMCGNSKEHSLNVRLTATTILNKWVNESTT